MANSSFFNKILAISPTVEILIRRFYWSNIKIFSKFKKNYYNNSQLTSFEKIKSQLIKFGLNQGDILVLHSSFDCLQKTLKSPKKIIDELLLLIGDNGTLVMNASRSFPEEKKHKDYLRTEYNNEVVVYDVKKSRVWTGVLPHTMVNDKRSKISRFPINPIVAIGSKAVDITENNFQDEFPCGLNSSWKYCVDNNALIVGIGVDLTHSLTIIHVAEDILGKNWPIKNWYRDRKFRVIDTQNNFDKIIDIKERHPKWGTLHFAERTLCKDLLKAGIMKSVLIDGVLIESLRANELIDFLNQKNQNGYPYFFPFL
jgi:aminoglycoside 3-N-acetyltransferase